MRIVIVVVLLALAANAHADKKIQEFIPALEREHGACTSQVAGMLKVSNGATALAKVADATEKAELEKAAAALAKGHAAVADYCNELGALVTYLKDNADAAYKTVEREIDARHTKVGTLRREAKRVVEELTPLTRKMIPRIMKVPTGPPDAEKRTPAKFPSGRVIELPVLAGTWRFSGNANSDIAEYSDAKGTASVTTRHFGGDCAAYRKSLKDATNLKDLPKSGNTTWAISYSRSEQSGGHEMIVLCAPDGAQSMLAIGDITMRDGAAALSVPITKFTWAMLALRVPPPK
jgi:hypothetical protein